MYLSQPAGMTGCWTYRHGERHDECSGRLNVQTKTRESRNYVHGAEYKAESGEIHPEGERVAVRLAAVLRSRGKARLHADGQHNQP